RLDANGAWSVAEAVEFAKRLSGYNIDFLEQPCETIEELADLKSELQAHSLNIKIAADASIRKADDPMRAAQSQVADILILKNQPLGGIAKVLELAEAANVPAVISSALESSVGISMSAYLAAALPDLKYACGLGTASMLQADVTDEPLIPRDGKIPVRRVNVSAEKLAEFSSTEERKRWWLERLKRCYEILTN
ncbi:MAG: enolase C-terminal domain-like protein, partial [Rhodoluna sp.]